MPDSKILLGVIGRAHGVRGLVKVTSHTAEPADLTAYGPLSDARGRLYSLRWKGDSIAEVSRIVEGKPVPITDRNEAEKLTNTSLYIDRSALPAADDDEYYLADLIGLTAIDTNGNTLGTIAAVHDYGAGTSLEIGDNLLIPFTAACVPHVDIAARTVTISPPDEVIVPSEKEDAA